MFCFPLLVSAQKTYRFFVKDAETGGNIKGLYCYILKNHNELLYTTGGDKDGGVTFTMPAYDSTATYQVEINNHHSYAQSGVYDISGIKNGEPVIKVKSATEFVPYRCRNSADYHDRPTSIFALTDLPADIQVKIKAHLVNRVGADFYNRLVFNSGEEFNHDKESTFKTDSNYKPRVYSLCFSILDPLTHEAVYSFPIVLGRHGELLVTPDVPDIKHNAAKANILTESQALAIAQKTLPRTTYGDAFYDTAHAAIMWRFEQTEQHTYQGVPVTVLCIDAHTGKISSKIVEMKTVVE